MIDFFPSSKIFIQIGPLSITWYALLIMTGAIIAFRISKFNLKKVGYDNDIVDDIFFGAIMFGFLGARVWYVLFSNISYYLTNPMSILAVWEGGLAIQGGLIGGGLFSFFYLKKKNKDFLQAADLIVPNILIAQALGRWGNFFNQEAYGSIVSESYINKFPTFIKDMMYINGNYHHPTFLYESVANIIGFILIVLIYKRLNRVRRGDLSYAYLMWYGVTRFAIESLRTDSLMFLGLRMAQLISILFVIIGLFGMLGGFRKLYPQKKPVILFDFDGTLASTEIMIFKSFEAIFDKYNPNHGLSEQEILRFNGLPIDVVLRDHFPGNEDEVLKTYRDIQVGLVDHYLVEKPGASELLRSLKEKGYQLGVVSNRSNPSLESYIKHLGMSDFFDIVISLDMVKNPKPDPECINQALWALGRNSGSLIMIGDTRYDIECGKRAGVFTIGCIFDTIREHEIEESKPNRIIRSFNEVEMILQEDIEWTTTTM